MNNNLSVSEVLKSAWQVFTDNISFVYYLFVPAFALSLVGVLLFPDALYFEPGQRTEMMNSFPSFILSLLSAAAGVFATISLLFFLRSEKKDEWSTWSSYFRLLPKYIGVCILQGLMILVGLIFLVIPGIYLAVRYAFVSYRTLEHPTESISNLFAAEAKATEGNRMNIFLIGLTMVVMAVVLGAILGSLFAGAFGARGSALTDFVFELVVTPFFTIVSILTYLRLTGKGAPEKTVTETAPEKPKEKEKEKEAAPEAKEPTPDPVPTPVAEPVL